MEQLLKSVTEAEALAAQKKSDAQDKAAEIIVAAHTQAAETLKNAESSLKVYRESALKEAETSAAAEMKKQLAAKQQEEQQLADALLADTKSTVSTIVRRVIDGDSRHA